MQLVTLCPKSRIREINAYTDLAVSFLVHSHIPACGMVPATAGDLYISLHRHAWDFVINHHTMLICLL